MKTLLFGLIFVSPPFLKKLLLRWFCSASIAPGARIGWFSSVVGSRVVLGRDSTICALTLIRLGGELRVGDESEISSFCLIYGASDLIVGDRSYIGPQSLINADEPVLLGHGSALGPRSMVFTHGSFLPFTKGYWSTRAEVTIGDQVWCAAGVFIHPATEIGDETFVNAASVVRSSIPSGSVVEGNPARVTGSIAAVRRAMTPERWQAAVQHMLADFAGRHLSRERATQQVRTDSGLLTVLWHGRRYEFCTRETGAGPLREGEGNADAARVWVLTPCAYRDGSPGGVLLQPTPEGRRERQLIRLLKTYLRRYYGVRLYLPDAGSAAPAEQRLTGRLGGHPARRQHTAQAMVRHHCEEQPLRTEGDLTRGD